MRIFTRFLLLVPFLLLRVLMFSELSAQNVSSPGKIPLQADPATGSYRLTGAAPALQPDAELLKWAMQNKGKPRGPHSWIPQTSVEFRPNVGQVTGTDGSPQPQIKYEVSSKGMHLYFAKDRVSYVFKELKNFMPGVPKTPESTDLSSVVNNLDGNTNVHFNQSPEPIVTPSFEYERIDLEFIGSNPNVEILAQHPTNSYINYYLPYKMTEQTHVSNYKMVVYKNIYENIDLVFYGSEKGIKYDFVVHPGGNPAQIQFRYSGAKSVELTADGGLKISGSKGTITEEKPFSFQEIRDELPNKKGTCQSSFSLFGDVVSFQIPDYDPLRLLVIDPTVAWSQMYGGNDWDIATAISANDADQAHITGYTFSPDFPVTPGALQATSRGGADAFVIKLAPNGSTAGTWVTYYGGGANPATTFTHLFRAVCPTGQFGTANLNFPQTVDIASDIKIDRTGNPIVLGTTSSTNLTITPAPAQNPTTNSGKLDLFLVKFRPDGTLLWSRYYGGAEMEGGGDLPVYITVTGPAAQGCTAGFGIAFEGFLMASLAIDGQNNYLVSTATNSATLPNLANSFDRTPSLLSDICIVKFNSDAIVQWTSLIGSSGFDFANSIAADQNDNIYVSGGTLGNDFPTLREFQGAFGGGNSDAVFIKLAPNSRRIISSYFGGAGSENLGVIAFNVGGGNRFITFWCHFGDVSVNSKGDVIMAGTTGSNAGIATAGAFDATYNGGGTDNFVALIAQSGGLGAVKWSTYLGGGSFDYLTDVHHYADDQVAVAGKTFSNNYPTVTPLQAAFGGPNEDGVLTILNPNGTTPLNYSTYIGGNSDDQISGITIAPSGTMYAAGYTFSNGTFLAPPAFNVLAAPRNANAGEFDVLILKFTEPTAPVPSCSGNFTTPIRVGILKYKVDLAMEYPNTLAALQSKFNNFILTEFTDPNAVTPGALAALDVFIIPEIEDPSVDYSLLANGTLGGRLINWVNTGGNVIFLGSNNRVGLNNGNFSQVITNSGFFPGSNQTGSDRLPLNANITNFTTCLTDRIPGSFLQSPTVTNYNIPALAPPFTFTSLLTGPATSMGVRTSSNAAAGKVFLLGFDYEAYDENTAQLLANAVMCHQPAAGRFRMQVSHKVTPPDCNFQPPSDGSIDLIVSGAPLPVLYNWSTTPAATTQDVTGLAPGNYTVTITAGPANACREVVTIRVPACPANLTRTDTTVCPKFSTQPVLSAVRTPAVPVTRVNGVSTITYCRTALPTSIGIATNDSLRFLGCGDYVVQAVTPVTPLPTVAPGKGDTMILATPRNGGINEFADGFGFSMFENVAIGFPFKYYCNTYRNLGINSNGFISFTEKQEGNFTASTRMPSDTIPNNILAFHWVQSMIEDRDANVIADISYIRDTTAGRRRFILKMENLRYFDFGHFFGLPQTAIATGTWSAQVVLYEGDSVDIFIVRSDVQPRLNQNLGPPFAAAPGQRFNIDYFKTMGFENENGTVGRSIGTNRNRTTGWGVPVATPERWRIRPSSPLNSIRYRWFSRNVRTGATTQIAGALARNLTLTGANIPATDTTRLIVQVNYNLNCIHIDSVQVNVDPPTVPGTVSATNATICPGGNATLRLTGQSPRGSILRWESSPVAGFTPITTINSTTTTITVNNITANTFFRAVVKNGECAEENSTAQQITIEKPEIGNAVLVNPRCFGDRNGSITLNVTLGGTPYTYQWFRGANITSGTRITDSTRAILANQPAGVYSVLVIDSRTCRDTLNGITLTEPTRVTPNLVRRENLRCFGGKDGIIEVTASGGTGPYTYRFTGETIPQANGLRTNLGAGCYNIVVTDANGCRDSVVNICLTEPTPLNLRIARKQDVTCNGRNDGQLVWDVSGGVPDYRFTWNPPVAINEDARNLPAGTYTIRVCDRNGSGCCKDTTVTITQPDVLRFTERTVVNVKCFGANDGAVNIEVQGGTSPRRYAWSNNVPAALRDKEDITGMAPGRYCVTVTDNKGCLLSECFDITQPQPLRLVFTETTPPLCNSSVNGCATAVGQGGVGGYTYRWLVDNSSNPRNCTLRGNIFNKVTVTDANGCSYTDSIRLNAPLPINIGVTQFANVTCNGRNDGIVNIDVTGGTRPYTYAWGDLTGSNQPEDRQNLSAGSSGTNYCVTVTDANGCTSDRCFRITQPDVLAIEIVRSVNPNCFGATNGLIDIRVTGGNIGTKRFNWTRDGAAFAGNTAQNQANLRAGRYELTVTDSLNCTATRVVTLTQPVALTATLRNVANVRCFGGCTGTASVVIEGGTQPYSFEWTDNRTAPQDRTNMCAGSYQFNVRDANGCTFTGSVAITQPTRLGITVVRQQNVTCFGANNGSILIQPTGGAGGYTFAWNTVPPQTTQNATGLKAASGPNDSVRVVLTDANGCTSTRAFFITQPDSINIAVAAQRRPSCNGGSDGSIQINVTGGVRFNAPALPYRYNWTRNNVFINSNQNQTNLSFGTYCVTVTDGNACTKVRCFTLTQPTAVSVTVKVNKTISCPGDLTGELEAMPTGGTPPYKYTWNSNGGFDQKIFKNRGAGTYNVLVTDSNGCTAAAVATLTQPAPLSVSVLQKTNINCTGNKSGAIEVAVVGGTSPYATYTWTGTGLPAGPVTTTEPRIIDLSPGIYRVEVKDANTCTAFLDNIVLTEPQFSVNVNLQLRRDVTCFGRKDGRIEINPTGGTGVLRAEWSGPGLSTVGTSITGLAAGNYCVTVTDNVGCSKTECFNINQPAELKIDTTSVKQVSCNGLNDGVITVQVTGGNSGGNRILWASTTNPNLARDVNSVTGLRPGVYTVCAADRLNCQACIQVVITEPLPITLRTQTVTAVRCNGQANGAITVEAEGGSGTGTFEYRWAGPGGYSGNGPTITGLKGGEYTLEVTKGTCKQSFTINVAEPRALRAILKEKLDVSCKDGSDGIIRLDIEGGTGIYTFNWTPTAPNIEDLTGLKAGAYSLTVTDELGCTANFSTTITEPDSVILTLQGISDVQCNGDSTGRIKVNVAGGTAPYRYFWTGGTAQGDTTGELSGKPAGFYNLTVRDAKGCVSGSRRYEIKQPLRLRPVVNNIQGETCKGKNDGVIQIQVEGGTQPIRYVWSFGDEVEDTTVVANQAVDKENLKPGTYRLVLLGTGGCLSDTTLVVPAADSIRIAVDQIRQPVCGTNCSGRILLTIEGGKAPYTYTWQDPGSPAAEDRADLCKGTYCLRITDANNCQKDTCFILDNTGGDAVITGLKERFCSGEDSVILSATPAGGTFTGTGIRGGNIFDPKLVTGGSTVITYVVTVDGCAFRKEQRVNVVGVASGAKISYTGFPAGPPFCTANSGFYVLTYNPAQVGLTAQFAGKGVTFNGVSYLFTPAAAGAGSHIITLTLVDNATQCNTVIRDTVTVSSPSNVQVNLSKNNICVGDSTQITVPGATSYSISPVTGLSCAPNCNNLTTPVFAKPTVTTNYVVSVNAAGCQAQRQVRVNVNFNPAIIIQANLTSVCAGTEVSLRAVSTGNYTYTWSPGKFFTDSTGRDVVARPTVTTTFTVTGTAQNGCKERRTITITVIPSLVNVTADKDTVCLGQPAVLTAESTQAGTFTFTWSPAAGLSAVTGASVTATPVRTTVYTVTRSGGGQCNSTTIRVAVRDTNATVTGLLTQYCANAECVNMSAIPAGGTFSGPGVTGTQFCPQTAGVGLHTIRYTVTRGGCNINRIISVRVSAPAGATITNILPEYCSLSNAVTLLPAIPGSEIKINNQVSNVLDPKSLPLGEVDVVVTPPANSGCFKDSTYKIRITEPQTEIVGYRPNYCINEERTLLVGLPAGGQFIGRGVELIGGSYFFNPAAAGLGTSTITYFGRQGTCTYSLTRAFTVNPSFTATAVVTNASSPTANDGKVRITVSGGIEPIRYGICSDNNPGNNPEISGLLPGNYCIQVIAGGCRITLNVTVGAGNLECTAPANSSLAVSEITPTSALINWVNVPNSLLYQVDYRIAGAPGNPTQVPIAVNSLRLTQLQCNTNYEVLVRAVCTNGGISPNTTVVTFKTGACEVLGCPPPTITSVNSLLRNTAVVNWNRVPEATGGYVLSWTNDPNRNTWTTVNISNQNTTQFTVRNLLANQTYCFRMASRCANNVRSAWSAVVCTTIVAGKLGDENSELNSNVTVYPNPNKGQFSVTISGSESEEATLELFDMNGKSIWNRSFTLTEGTNEVRYDETGLSSGVYLLRYISGTEVRTLKLMVE